MESNLEVVRRAVDWIEAHLNEDLRLERIAREAGYSQYHLHRLFLSVVGFPVHKYVKRRRLTEAARRLVRTAEPIAQIALDAGYESQQAFATGFKGLYKVSPLAYRRRGDYHPLQLKFQVDGWERLRGDRILRVDIVERGAMRLVGFVCDTRWGFFGIGRCWRKLQARKGEIPGRIDMDALYGFNDYANWAREGSQPVFDAYAAACTAAGSAVPKGMACVEAPAAKYAVFTYRARSQDSLRPVADYIYQTWFPQSTCRLSESAPYDFARYEEAVDEKGHSRIEYWVPIL